MNKLYKDQERIKLNIDVLCSEANLIKINIADEFISDTFNRTGQQEDAQLRDYANEDSVITLKTSLQQQQIHIQAVDIDEAIILERERDLKKLKHDLELVHDMYK